MTGENAIAIIGGTGALGSGLAYRCAVAGYPVIIGSRDGARAASAAQTLSEELPGANITGCDNRAAAKVGTTIIVTVPFASQLGTLQAIAPFLHAKLVIDATVPLVPPKVARVQLPRQGSAAAIAAATLNGRARLVTAFHNVSAQKLRSGDAITSDILVFGDDLGARDLAIELMQAIGIRGLHGGPLANAVAAEAMTSVLIAMNRRYKIAEGAGIRITGIEP